MVNQVKKKIKVTYNSAQYLPLYNKKSLKSSITPFLGGDIKTDHHHYLLEPTSELDLYSNHMSRNMIFTIDGQTYFLNGHTQLQQEDDVEVEYDLLYQKVTRKNDKITIQTTSFIPIDDDCEILQVSLQNNSNKDIEVDAITAIPIYARSADNIRDHRHVTSLLNRIKVDRQCVIVKPTLTFNERGHETNKHSYVVSAYNEDIRVNRFITNIDDFLLGGSLNYPKGIYQRNLPVKDGYEAIAGIGFDKIILRPGETTTFNITLGIFKTDDEVKTIEKYQTKDAVSRAFDQMIAYFKKESKKLSFDMVNDDVKLLLKWVRLQPVLRRIFGNSYLPHHDYGRGGRGWRDLWQDLLSLILLNDEGLEHLLINNFRGVRIDGSNATIIGDEPGKFLADRNKIVRVWSDHGAWPLLTTLSYIDATGNLDILFVKQKYFNDQFTHYTNKTKSVMPENDVVMKDGKPYEGTILEHLLLQNIVAHFNVGQFGFVRLENADWNDGLDMAKEHGETIAFTHFYASNLKKLAEIIKITNKPIYLFNSLYELIFNQIDLNRFFDQVSEFKDDLVLVDKDELSVQLYKLYEERINHINQHAWIGESHLQSYITNQKVFLDNEYTMNLTGQAMALLNETLTHEQAKKIAHSTEKMLFNEAIGGYHLNSNYGDVNLDLGRAFGFAYNHKENGAIFSHMALMYVYGLYNYNLVDLGNRGYKALINRAINPESNTVLGIPEYFTESGVGKYLYLTGSASWLLKLLQEQVFGIRFKLGKLSLEPKLSIDDFIDGKASITTHIHRKLITITYINKKKLPYGKYKVSQILSKGKPVSLGNINSDIEVYLDEI